MRFEKREDLKNLLSEDFYQYYRIHRNNRYEKLTSSTSVNYAVQMMFMEMLNMMQECNHGIALKNFGVIAPKESVYEDKDNVFQVKYKKRGGYLIFMENEYLQSQYKPFLASKYFGKKEDKKVTEIKKPRPHAVLLHRKKLRKNKLKND
jgi:hypothetical protein